MNEIPPRHRASNSEPNRVYGDQGVATRGSAPTAWSPGRLAPELLYLAADEARRQGSDGVVTAVEAWTGAVQKENLSPSRFVDDQEVFSVADQLRRLSYCAVPAAQGLESEALEQALESVKPGTAVAMHYNPGLHWVPLVFCLDKNGAMSCLALDTFPQGGYEADLRKAVGERWPGTRFEYMTRNFQDLTRASAGSPINNACGPLSVLALRGLDEALADLPEGDRSFEVLGEAWKGWADRWAQLGILQQERIVAAERATMLNSRRPE